MSRRASIACPACEGERVVETGDDYTDPSTGTRSPITVECDFCGGTGGIEELEITKPPVTYCRDCDGVHAETRRQEPWQWRCIRAPAQGGYGYVDPDFAPNPPYHFCKHVNTSGACPMFEPIPEPNESEQPKTKTYLHRKRDLEATHR